MQQPPPKIDPRQRSYVMPARVLWTSESGVHGADGLLTDDDHGCTLEPAKGERVASILLDFGRELHGGVRLEVPQHPAHRPSKVRIRFGESAAEAMGTPNQDHAIHEQEVLLPWYGHAEFGNTGFRFVRIDHLDTDAALPLQAVKAVHIIRPLPYVGSFKCSDDRLNQIWDTGAYTVHLCMQDHVWDGIKRDRLVWIGDLHPEMRVISTLFGNHSIVEESLDYVRDRTPLPQWMNGISSYSLWWILCQRDWWLWGGDRDYLAAQKPYLVGLLQQVRSRMDARGCEKLDGHRFLEWPTSRDNTAIDAGLQALVVLALDAGAQLCRVLGERDPAAEAAAAADRGRKCVRQSGSKQANALMVMAGMEDAAETNRRILSKDPYRGLSTFYGFYVLEARQRAGDTQGALDLMRNYWGGMLDAGATTFWEGFELDWLTESGRIDQLTPPGKKDLHADYGDYCYVGLRHSLCHGWAAGPTAWMSEHVLGLSPAAPGWSEARLAPHLGDLSWAEGTVPTPHGVIRVRHEKRGSGIRTSIDAPAKIKIQRSKS